jgi:hypothetical protein
MQVKHHAELLYVKPGGKLSTRKALKGEAAQEPSLPVHRRPCFRLASDHPLSLLSSARDGKI